MEQGKIGRMVPLVVNPLARGVVEIFYGFV